MGSPGEKFECCRGLSGKPLAVFQTDRTKRVGRQASKSLSSLARARDLEDW